MEERHEPVPVESPGARGPGFMEILKSWLLCGWITNQAFLKPGYVEVVSRASSGVAAGVKPYVRPSRWTQLVRKCRARFRRSNCYNVQQHHQQEHEYYYKMDSYERNFDRGREYWEDFPVITHPLKQDSAPWTAEGIPAGPAGSVPVPDPVWMIQASQEEIKEKAAAIMRAKQGAQAQAQAG